ncbi:hypothetical protein CEE37_03965 [candidate division LCP-89 bacterium B3_LCP]|uniref:Transglutaminase-like domain-containing protein n=1 Tax=candidate division LCP-89 bacterium B3_LCP TaxID=2012998 RepID=A0A532V3F6_UNCL8|nr:MAG: hypothetical protein CEE37_03965 [candidate division LCP-89 bacterium B3_LCP]
MKQTSRRTVAGVVMIFTAALVWVFIISPNRVTVAQDKYKSGPAPAYQDLKYKTDLEFAKFLQKEWMKADILPGISADIVPKPVDIPEAEITDDDQERLEEAIDNSRSLKPELVPPSPLPEPKPIPDKAPEPTMPRNLRTVHLDFFEASCEISYEASLWVPLGRAVNNQLIGRFWESISRTNYEDFLAQAAYYRNRMILNDWGFAFLLLKIGEEIYPNSSNGAVLFTWFMLVKSGYDARVGYYKENVHLLLPSGNVWYGTPYFTIGSKTYYVAVFGNDTKQVKSLFIYKEAYPGASKNVEVAVEQPPEISSQIKQRNTSFSYRGKTYDVAIDYDKATVDFFAAYPQTDLNVYFDAPVSKIAGASLIAALEPIVSGKSEAEAVNILLRFVQTAFDYKTDGEQFGREKYFFPEEIFHYSHSDCEDRSVFFAYLVRNLTGLEVIGLDYPGHVATAVKFSDALNGEYVTFNGTKYIICDPTYIHANLGMCMPQFKEVTPDIVQIRT